MILVEGEDENHHEKKSVLKKVKDKAKKIKSTLTKHGHHDDHDNTHGHEEYEEEYEDEEMAEDPEVHGAPSIYTRYFVHFNLICFTSFKFA